MALSLWRLAYFQAVAFLGWCSTNVLLGHNRYQALTVPYPTSYHRCVSDAQSSDVVKFYGQRDVLVGWPDQTKGPFFLEAKWVKEAGHPVCVGLTLWKDVVPATRGRRSATRVQPAAPLDGLGGTDLRSIPLAQVLELLWAGQRGEELAQKAGWASFDWAAADDISRELRPAVERLLASPLHFDDKGPRRRLGDDTEHFAAVAMVYEAALANPGRKRPTDAVRHQFGVSYSTATKWVHHARSMGFLPPTTPGKPAGTDTTITKSSTRGER